MSLPLLQLPVEILQQITTHLSTLSKYALALALVGRPRPGDGVSEQHVRALQRLLLPTKLTLLMEVEKISPRELPERVRLHTQHLHIDCQLCELMGEFEGEEVDANPARLDAAYMVERLATVMCLSWPAVVEATVEVSGEMPGAPLSLVMSRLPALQRLTVEAWGAGPGLADACTIVGSLGTGALESLTISNGTSTNKTDLSSALVPLTSLTGLRRLVVVSNGGSGDANPQDDVLAPLTQLTALSLRFGEWRPIFPASLPASLAGLTALRELECTGFRRPSPQELLSLMSPLTQLTALSCPIVLDGSCGLPELPSLRTLEVEQVAGGGLALLAASCPALVSLATSRPIILTMAKGAAARLPALTSLSFGGGLGSAQCAALGSSLPGCAPALQRLVVSGNKAAIDPTPLISKLKGLSQLQLYPCTSPEPLLKGTRTWRALAALPAVRAFAGCVELGWEPATMAACVSFCGQLTELHLGLRLVWDSQVECCVAFAAAMTASRVQAFHVTPGRPVAATLVRPALPTPFWEHLAAWQCLSSVQIDLVCTDEQLSVLCASPTVTSVVITADDNTADERLTAHARKLMLAHRGKELHISIERKMLL